MEPIKINAYTLIWLGAGLGLLLGLIPLILGIRKSRTRLGLIGLACSAIGGAIAGIFLIIPILAVFIWLILKKPDAEANSTESFISDKSAPEDSISKARESDVSDLSDSTSSSSDDS